MLLGSTTYSGNIDMWGVGCIFFEMSCGRPMFPGSSVEEELALQWKILGTPNEDTWPGITKNDEFVSYHFPCYPCESLTLHAPRLDRDAIDLLERLLRFESKNRISATEALQHPYFQSLGQRIHPLPHSVSIFTLPECELASNPGQKKDSSSSSSSAHNRERRKSTIY